MTTAAVAASAAAVLTSFLLLPALCLSLPLSVVPSALVPTEPREPTKSIPFA